MKLYRIVDSKDFNINTALDGQRASLFGGRWNPKGLITLYCATQLETAICEKAYYAITTRLEVLGINAKTKKINSDRKKVIDSIKLKLIEFEFSEDNLCSIYDDESMERALRSASMQTRGVQEGRKSPYEKLPERWTAELGNRKAQVPVDGLLTKSARADFGYCLPIYLNKALLNEIINIKVSDIQFFLANDKAAKWKSGDKLNPLGLMFEYNGSLAPLEILDFPV